MNDPNPVVLERTVQRTRVFELNRPERLNAVNLDLYERLVEGLDRAQTESSPDGDLRAIVIIGAGRAFCVGADLKAHGEGRPDPVTLAKYVAAGQAANLAIQECSLPVVAAVNGHAIGAGLELALSADFMIVAEDAKLRLPEIALGTFIGGGVSYTLAERVGALKAKELIVLGRFFLGAEAARLGVANVACPSAAVERTALAWADELATAAPRSLAWAKQLLARTLQERRDALDREATALLDCMQTADWQEGVDAFAERRAPKFTGQ